MTLNEGLQVLVIGAGFGGLACAIELATLGCIVEVFESAPNLNRPGDVIQIGPNATRILKKWGSVLPELVAVAAQPANMVIRDQHGKILLQQPAPIDYDGSPNLFANRGMAQRLMHSYAESLGVKFTFGAKITEYFEDERQAGFILNGEKHSADLLIAGDGVYSRARNFVTKTEAKAEKSGFAVFRSWFELAQLDENNPKTDWIKNAKEDLMEVWIGEDTHSIIMVNTKLKTLTCFAVHKDTADITESWSLPGKVEDMLKVVKGWDTTLAETIKCIPAEALIDYKLLWRDPVKQWVSEHGRMVLVGDAAHPHLSTSGTGGAQAIEDGGTLGSLLQLTTDIPLAARVFEKLRFERTSLTQRMGWETRHRWHQTDWEALAADPEILKFPQPKWLNGSDAEQYANDNFHAVVSHLEKGTPFTSTNVPEGYVHKDWTIKTMMAMEGQAAGKDFYVVDNKAI